MDIVEALQLRAAHAVLEPDRQAWLRHVMRAYSKAFHTPLHVVESLPLEDVLTAYFENVIEQMDDDSLAEFHERLLMTPEELAAESEEETLVEKNDGDFFEKLESEVKEGVVHGPPKERRIKLVPKKAAVPAALPPPAPPGPDIKMAFGGGNLEEEWGSRDPLAPPPKKVS